MLDNSKESQILAAAKQSFEMLGYKGTTIDQIARLANIGKGTVYTIFKTKEEIFNRIVDEEIKRIQEIEMKIFEEKKDSSVLHEVVYEIFYARSNHPLVKKLNFEMKAHNTWEVVQALRKVEKHTQQQLESMITQLIEKNQLQTYRVDLTAFLIGEIYKGLLTTWEEEHGPLTKEEIGMIFDNIILSGIGAKSRRLQEES